MDENITRWLLAMCRLTTDCSWVFARISYVLLGLPSVMLSRSGCGEASVSPMIKHNLWQHHGDDMAADQQKPFPHQRLGIEKAQVKKTVGQAAFWFDHHKRFISVR
ncbi:MAG TPA: hypothetical protein DIT62_07355 [Alphaproteobacteria bacterium]|nr:hypothetical protein [Alphaproteobacteria bacterium]|tara:strand:- start:994 stop:1311 length:318 start_codon:yes stop_codon:yes gene_type:complete